MRLKRPTELLYGDRAVTGRKSAEPLPGPAAQRTRARELAPPKLNQGGCRLNQPLQQLALESRALPPKRLPHLVRFKEFTAIEELDAPKERNPVRSVVANHHGRPVPR